MAEYRFEVNPLPLDDVDQAQALVKFDDLLLPYPGFIRKSFVVGRILKGLQETLIVSDLQKPRVFYENRKEFLIIKKLT